MTARLNNGQSRQGAHQRLFSEIATTPSRIGIQSTFEGEFVRRSAAQLKAYWLLATSVPCQLKLRLQLAATITSPRPSATKIVRPLHWRLKMTCGRFNGHVICSRLRRLNASMAAFMLSLLEWTAHDWLSPSCGLLICTTLMKTFAWWIVFVRCPL